MRKKLRNRYGETRCLRAERPTFQAFRPSAQEVAQCCASSCAHSGVNVARQAFSVANNIHNTLIYITLVVYGTDLDNSHAPTGRYRLPGTSLIQQGEHPWQHQRTCPSLAKNKA